MAGVEIWHNPHCSKSRNALGFLQEEGVDTHVVRYLDTPHTHEEIKTLLKMLGLSARDLLRTGEAIYKELGLKDEKEEEKLIDAMVEHPRLIERPIVIKDGRAVIGRPIEKVIEFIKEKHV